MATLALFDFDHTLYRKDSLLEFTKFHCGSGLYTGMLKLLPHLLLMKVGLATNEKTKIRYFTHFFRNMDYHQFCASAEKFATERIPADINQALMEKLQQHMKSAHEVYIVTASVPEWIEPWSKQYNVKVIGTTPEVIDGKLTGRFSTPNCSGSAKVDRISEIVDVNSFEKIVVYGKGPGDREMLKLARSVRKASS